MIPPVIFINSYHPAFLNSLYSFLFALDKTAPQGQKEKFGLTKGPSNFSIWESSKDNRVDWDPVNNPDGEFTEPTPYGDIDKKVRTALPFFLRIASLGSRSNPLVHTKADAANVLYHISSRPFVCLLALPREIHFYLSWRVADGLCVLCVVNSHSTTKRPAMRRKGNN